MSFAAKVVITIVVCFLLFAVGSVGLVVYLVSRHGGELSEGARRQAEQGVLFGRDTDEAGCLQEAIARYRNHRGLAGSMTTSMFVQGCWSVTRPTPGFCDGVPDPLSIDIFSAARWQKERTRQAGLDEPFGGQIFAQQRAYCGARAQRRQKELSPR